MLSQQAPNAQVQAVAEPMPAGVAAGVNLLLVDPPQRKGWAATVRQVVPEGSALNALIIWLPVNGSKKRASSSWKPTTTATAPRGMMSPVWSAEVLWDNAEGCPADGGVRAAVRGSPGSVASCC